MVKGVKYIIPFVRNPTRGKPLSVNLGNPSKKPYGQNPNHLFPGKPKTRTSGESWWLRPELLSDRSAFYGEALRRHPIYKLSMVFPLNAGGFRD